MTGIRIVLALAMAAQVTLAASPQQGPAGDLEVRTTRDTFAKETLTSLTLLLKGPSGPLPINMVVTTVEKAGAAPGTTSEVRLQFDLPLYVGERDYRAPHLVFTLDKGTPAERALKYDADSRAILHTARTVSVPFSAGALSTLARAGTIHGTFLGVPFVLSSEQVRAIKSFAARS